MKGILVGLGKRSRGWVAACREHPDVELVAVCDTDPGARERFAAEAAGGPAVFAGVAEALDAVGADFVLDVTPPSAHGKVALAAFAAGLHVLGEKPMCETMAEAREVVAAGESAGVVHMIAQNYRFGPLPRTTRRLIAGGAIGRPGQVHVALYVSWADRPGSYYVTAPYMFLTDMGVHHFDLMRYVLAADPLSVRATSWNQPWGWHAGDACHAAVFDFPDSLKAVHVGMGCCMGRQTTANGDWRIEGPEGGILWADDRIVLAREHRTDRRRREEVAPDALPATGTAAILSEFVAAVRERREPECSARDNLKSLAMALGAVESARTGGAVDLRV